MNVRSQFATVLSSEFRNGDGPLMHPRWYSKLDFHHPEKIYGQDDMLNITAPSIISKPFATAMIQYVVLGQQFGSNLVFRNLQCNITPSSANTFKSVDNSSDRIELRELSKPIQQRTAQPIPSQCLDPFPNRKTIPPPLLLK